MNNLSTVCVYVPKGFSKYCMPLVFFYESQSLLPQKKIYWKYLSILFMFRLFVLDSFILYKNNEKILAKLPPYQILL